MDYFLLINTVQDNCLISEVPIFVLYLYILYILIIKIIISMHPLSSVVLIFGLPFLSSSKIFSLRFYLDVVLNNSQNK